jgi:hypothetical protein
MLEGGVSARARGCEEVEMHLHVLADLALLLQVPPYRAIEVNKKNKKPFSLSSTYLSPHPLISSPLACTRYTQDERSLGGGGGNVLLDDRRTCFYLEFVFIQ